MKAKTFRKEVKAEELTTPGALENPADKGMSWLSSDIGGSAYVGTAY